MKMLKMLRINILTAHHLLKNLYYIVISLNLITQEKPNGSRTSGCLTRLGKTVMSMTQVLEYLKTMEILENNIIIRVR